MLVQSPNLETFPQDAVGRVQMSSYDKNSPFYEVDMKDLHPFGRLRVKLVRTYHRECEEGGQEATGISYLILFFFITGDPANVVKTYCYVLGSTIWSKIPAEC